MMWIALISFITMMMGFLGLITGKPCNEDMGAIEVASFIMFSFGMAFFIYALSQA